MDDKNRLLAGVKVLDISHQYAGALAAAYLADMGADVLQVENPKGSPLRSMLPRKDGQSVWWKVAMRGKKCVSLNLNHEKGRELFLEIAKKHEVIIENFRPGTLEKWGLGPADLEAEGVNAVLLRISGFGQTGPYSSRAGYGSVAEAMSGFAYLTGEPDGDPVFTAATLADSVTGTFGAMGILAVLVNRARSGVKGVEVVDCALAEAMLRLHTPSMLPLYSLFGTIKGRVGNCLVPHGTLRDVYKSKDGVYFTQSSIGDAVVRRLTVAIGAQDLVDKIDAGAANDPKEWEAFLFECNARIKEWAGNTPYAEISKRLEEESIAYQTIYNAKDIVEDPQYREREDVVTVPDAQLGGIMMPGVVPKFSKHEHKVSHAGLDIGTNNHEVYREFFGFDDGQIEALKEEGVM
jgi:crotonobetainyl-CoA:carnitine CoA-transferase CaiB-like acyl-CoA transferase